MHCGLECFKTSYRWHLYSLQCMPNIMILRCFTLRQVAIEHSFSVLYGILACACTCVCSHLSSCWWTLTLISFFCCYKSYCYEHCGHISLGTRARALQGHPTEVELQITGQSRFSFARYCQIICQMVGEV